MLDSTQEWNARESELLNQAVQKVVRFGESAGITPEDMIALLDSGCTIRDLLAFLAGTSV